MKAVPRWGFCFFRRAGGVRARWKIRLRADIHRKAGAKGVVKKTSVFLTRAGRGSKLAFPVYIRARNQVKKSK